MSWVAVCHECGGPDGPADAYGEGHKIEKVVEPGWEQVVYCPRTGVVG